MGFNFKTSLIGLATLSLAFVSCQKSSTTSSTAPKSLYVASGQCYSGSGITTYSPTTASRAVTKWATDSGVSQGVFTDLNVGSNVSVGTVPQALVDKGSYLLMLTENAATPGDRKIFKIDKATPGTYVTYANDPTALTIAPSDITRSFAEDIEVPLYSANRLLPKG